MRKLLAWLLRVAVAAAAAVAAAFLAIGLGLAILFELQGFGRPRDTEPRLWYVALLAVGLVIDVLIAVAVLQRRRRR